MEAAKREERRTGERGIVSNRSRRIEAYMKRLENVFLNPEELTEEQNLGLSGKTVGKRNIEILRPKIHENSIIKDRDFPESHFEHQKQILTERGMGDVTSTSTQRREEIRRVQESQRRSLDAWIDYLSGRDCRYPADIKYFAMQGVFRLGNFDTTRYSFTKRRPDTTAPFAEIDREALSKVLGAMNAKHHGGDTESYWPRLLQMIDGGSSFGDLYAEAMRFLDEQAGKENLLPITAGEWRVFPKRSDARFLTQALEGKRSNLCLADVGSAQSYLNQGAVEIYFSNDRAGQPSIPRIALAYNESGVYEVRGTFNTNEDIDPYMARTNILSDRLKNVPHGKSFEKKDRDMRKVTELAKKREHGEEFTPDDLMFLYEINGPIEGFGYNKDPRVAELIKDRNTEEDEPRVFGCTGDQIAHFPSEINRNTKAYAGGLFPGIFELPLEHIYIIFPDIPIRRMTVQIGEKNPQELLRELQENKILFPDDIPSMLNSDNFEVARTHEQISFIRIKVKYLGFYDGATTEQIYVEARRLGLELVPPEVGPNLRLAHLDQPLNEGYVIGMKPIISHDGSPVIFIVVHIEDGLGLGLRLADRQVWHPDDEFIFRPRSTIAPDERREAERRKYEPLLLALEEKYGLLGSERLRAEQFLIDIEHTFGELDFVRGKRILDLGCGATIPKIDNEKTIPLSDREQNPTSRQFEPWLSRILKELGAEPVGIDAGNLEGEQFEHYNIDLSQPGALNILPDHSFDAINMWSLLDSPALRLGPKEKRRMRKELEQQKQRLLKKDGRIIRWDIEL